MVVAYLAGMPVEPDYFNNIPACTNPNQTGCICSWRTFREGHTDSFISKENSPPSLPTRLHGILHIHQLIVLKTRARVAEVQ
jgi:hypothetical protein